MSSTLNWRPLHSNEKDLSDELKFMLRKEYGEPVNCVLRDEDIKFLRGLSIAGASEADELIAGISKFGEIEVKEVF